ncbi:transcriptional regulatory protein EmbR [Mycobacterium antarcticum]|uniref:BTAD domain-containing putative transcriptional regulator n=1 Tax=unclassified Mycolicibacterium TaxID=2636767 RepID=UPI002385D1DD|nr:MULTISPECIES: BTAD domain-containing putative transcriptional regulator [unclassified Mycolicibacterium]BDX34717.1 transcriptional regulatory protein EmbR [Mycolicibacterium sp. TUM20985]GLP77920.1 transcriptional regulatory protein EmbR [Mycolicibacterium sp. TUM20983]
MTSSAVLASGLDFGVLGPFRVSLRREPVPLGTPKQSAVLALLLINRNRPVPRDSIISAIWDEDAPQADAIHNLHVYVANLRKVLGSAGVDPKTVLASARPGYQLNVPDGACDLGRFTTDKAAGVQAAAAGRFGLASDRLSAALAQWRGPVLDDLREFRFVQSFATALVEDKVVAHVVRAESEIACGRGGSVIGELEGLVAEHPYREPLWTQLITAYYATERQTDALNAYRRLRSVLSDELGIEPGPTLRTLEQRILRQEPLDVRQIAQNDASEILTTLERHTTTSAPAGSSRAQLRDAAGRCYPLETVTTGIGRRGDNGVVLDDPKVSRYHATIIDTGANFVINDLRSANGVHVSHQRIRGSATLSDGAVIGIGGYQFTFEIAPAEPPAP